MNITLLLKFLFLTLIFNNSLFCSENFPREEEHIFEFGKGYIPNKTPFSMKEKAISQTDDLFFGRVYSHFQDADDPTQGFISKGSGVMISPSCVLTLASNVANNILDQGYIISSKIIFIPASQGENQFPYEIEVTQRKVFKEWARKGDSRYNYNLALLKLQRPLGLQIGYVALKEVNNLINQPIKIKGCMSGKEEGKDVPFEINSVINSSNDHMLYYTYETGFGSSGAPLLINIENNPICIGLHIGAHEGVQKYGISITEEKLERIKKWLADFGEISMSEASLVSQKELNDLSQDLTLRLETEEERRSKYMPSTESKGKTEEVDKEKIEILIRSQERNYVTGISIDGGGMRGIMPALWVEEIEKITNRPVHKLFNHVGGTSIGGILALGYTAPVNNGKPLSSRTFVELFEKRGEEIFPQRSKYNIFGKIYDKFREIIHSRYNPAPLENLLKEYFKEGTLGNVLSNVMVTSLSATTHDPILFESFRNSHKGYFLWQIGRATSAAPTFFPSYSFESGLQLIDGGMYYNNPTSLLMDSMHNAALERDEYLLPSEVIMVSLGTGEPLRTSIPSNAGWGNAAKPVIDTLMNTSSRAVHQRIQQLLPKDQYLRVNPDLKRDMELDSVSSEDISFLREISASQYEEIENFFTGDNSKFRYFLEKKD